MHLGLPHLPVNLEWLLGLVGTFAKSPAVGGELDLFMYLGSGLGFHGEGKIG